MKVSQSLALLLLSAILLALFFFCVFFAHTLSDLRRRLPLMTNAKMGPRIKLCQEKLGRHNPRFVCNAQLSFPTPTQWHLQQLEPCQMLLRKICICFSCFDDRIWCGSFPSFVTKVCLKLFPHRLQGFWWWWVTEVSLLEWCHLSPPVHHHNNPCNACGKSFRQNFSQRLQYSERHNHVYKPIIY